MTTQTRSQPDLFDTWLDITPMRRSSEPPEAASAIAYLASPDPSYIAETMLSIDCGYKSW